MTLLGEVRSGVILLFLEDSPFSGVFSLVDKPVDKIAVETVDEIIVVDATVDVIVDTLSLADVVVSVVVIVVDDAAVVVVDKPVGESAVDAVLVVYAVDGLNVDTVVEEIAGTGINGFLGVSVTLILVDDDNDDDGFFVDDTVDDGGFSTFTSEGAEAVFLTGISMLGGDFDGSELDFLEDFAPKAGSLLSFCLV